jgi:hypothetical protein
MQPTSPIAPRLHHADVFCSLMAHVHHMKTRLTEMLGIQHPIVLPGMTYIAVPGLVAAVCNAGGFAILASGALSPEACRAAIREVRRLTDKPFGVGCSLMLPGATECARVALEERVPVINVSMGKGEWVIEGARAYGGKVIATISNEKHARSAIDSGVDGLIVTGHEAAAHGGKVTSMVLIPAVRDMTPDLPLIAAGGFADGRGAGRRRGGHGHTLRELVGKPRARRHQAAHRAQGSGRDDLFQQLRHLSLPGHGHAGRAQVHGAQAQPAGGHHAFAGSSPRDGHALERAGAGCDGTGPGGCGEGGLFRRGDAGHAQGHP